LVDRSGNVGQQLRSSHSGPFLIALTESWKEDCKCYRSFSESDLKRIEKTASCAISIHPSFLTIRAVRDATDHYLLTYETHSRSSRPEWRKIQVKVNRRGVAVSARTGVMIAPLTTEEKKREQIVDALASSMDLPGLLLDWPRAARTSGGQSLTLSLRLRSDASHPGVWSGGGMDFTVAAGVLKGTQLLQCFAEDIHSQLSDKTALELDEVGLAWSHQMAAPQDATAVRVVVRDNKNGRIGSITQGLP